MASISERLHDKIVAELEKVIEEKKEDAVAGPLPYEEYRRVVGLIAGLRLAKEMIGQALVDIMKG